VGRRGRGVDHSDGRLCGVFVGAVRRLSARAAGSACSCGHCEYARVVTSRPPAKTKTERATARWELQM
jgi:hypothetical protein